MRSSTVFVLSLAIASLTVNAYGGQPTDTLPGFKANNVFESHGIDHVNLFNGDPGIVLPLGPEYPLSPGNTWQLRAHYSPKFWHFDQNCPADLSGSVRHAVVRGYPTLGAGWTLELGYFYVQPDVEPQFSKTYHSPDGGIHTFDAVSFQTTDRSLLRYSSIPGGYKVEFADGTVQTFTQAYQAPVPISGTSRDFTDVDWEFYTSQGLRYGLTSIRDSFGNLLLTVDYVGGSWKVSQINLNPGTPQARSIVYNWGTQNVGGPLGVTWDVLASIVFPTANGSLTVAFAFDLPGGSGDNPVFGRNAYDNSAALGLCVNPGAVFVPLLDTITLSGAGVSPISYQFRYILPPEASNFRGVLKRILLPTRGTIDYGYFSTTDVCFQSPLCPDPETGASGGSLPSGPLDPIEEDWRRFWDESPAVVGRTETDPITGLTSTVSYSRYQFVPIQPAYPFGPDPDRIARRTIVTRPSGNGSAQVAVRHVFNVSPFPRSQSGAEIARRYYPDANALGTPTRTVINCYEAGPGPSQPTCGYRDTLGNIQILAFADEARQQKSVTWYGVNPANGGTCPTGPTFCSTSARSDYNSIAKKYATEVVTTTLPAMSGWTSRTSNTNWTPSVDSTHWLLDLFSFKEVSDQGTGLPAPTVVRTNYQFSPADGFLQNTSLADGTNGTLTRTFTSDGLGNPGTERVLGSAGLVGDFTDTRGFQTGLALTSQRSGIGWRSFDVTRDPSTGLITKSRDPNASLETSYSYDALGRLTRIDQPTIASVFPSQEAATTICYVAAVDDTTPALAIVKKRATDPCSRDDGVPTVGSGTFEGYQYDGFGRVIRHFRRMPNTLSTGSYFAVQETRYDAAGHRSYLSEWLPCAVGTSATSMNGCISTIPAPPNPGPGTTWSNFDLFDRARTITRADGSVATISFDDPDNSISHSDHFESVTASVNGLPATTVTRRDVLGRILSVREPTITGMADLTEYRYNVIDKLASVTQSDLSGNTQTRLFNYDAFGFLRSESTPEKGTATYTSYDALGNVLDKSDGGIGYTYSYDLAGRLTTVSTNEGGGQTYLSNSYDAGSGFPAGKLTGRTATNFALSPPATVVDSFVYAGVGGRLSSLTTTVNNAGTAPVTTQKWYYNDLGLVANHLHPRAVSIFSVFTDYVSGLPTRVLANGLPVVTGATYNPSAALASYATGDNSGFNVTTTIQQDASLLPRPARISTTVTGGGSFDTGAYSYDGSGNILAMGSDTFGYDPRSRITSAALSGLGNQSFSYDRFGNLLSKGSTTYSVSPLINRLTTATYDARGNLTANASEQYAYDGLNQQIRHQGPGIDWKYLFDGDGERLAKIPISGTGIIYTLRDEGKRISTEYLDLFPTRDNVFLGNLLVGSYSACGPGWLYYSSDHLGSPRFTTNPMGLIIERRRYWPYGEEATTYLTGQRLQFAMMERDFEANRYYDHARSHEFGLGRFLSPDKLQGKTPDPQSWNRYTYARNNPVKLVDPNGLCAAPAGVGNGNVGVCVEAFIAANRIRGGLALGDARGFSGNDPSLTARVQIQFTVNTQTGKVGPPSVTTGTSYVLFKSPVTGKEGTTVSSVESVPTGNNSTSISVGATSWNGFAGLPGAPSSPIQFNVGLDVSSSGQVTVDPNSTQAKGYPSFAAYAYGPDGSIITLFEQGENKIGDLNKPMQPLKPESYPACADGTMVGPCPR